MSNHFTATYGLCNTFMRHFPIVFQLIVKINACEAFGNQTRGHCFMSNILMGTIEDRSGIIHFLIKLACDEAY